MKCFFLRQLGRSEMKQKLSIQTPPTTTKATATTRTTTTTSTAQ